MKISILLFFISICCFSQQIGGLEGVNPEELSKKELRQIRLANSPITATKATFYSAILPGLGQAYVGRLWYIKIPLIYAALGISGYYYVYQSQKAETFRTAYKRRIAGYFDDEYANRIFQNDQLIEGMKFHQRFRDFSALFFIGFYVLNIIEANVSANLLQFNVSDDLSMKPYLQRDNFLGKSEGGIVLALKL